MARLDEEIERGERCETCQVEIVPPAVAPPAMCDGCAAADALAHDAYDDYWNQYDEEHSDEES